MALQYVHQELGEDVAALAGFYTPRKEVKLEYEDKLILYVVGQGTAEDSCGGSATWAYATVLGYLLAWRSEVNEAGAPVSEVEPIRDSNAKREIARIIRDTENIASVDFW